MNDNYVSISIRTAGHCFAYAHHVTKGDKKRKIRFRTLGCYPLTAGIESDAETIDEVINETMVSKKSERNGRLIDKDDTG